jgi:cytochrome b subunit of formate dehydrogenase
MRQSVYAIMEKQLAAYLSLMSEALAELENHPDHERLRHLIVFHQQQTTAFQHERLIHLLVTFFFSGLLLCSIAGTLLLPSWPFFALDVLLAVTLLFYIKHYFFLENRVQQLYPITEALYRRLGALPSSRSSSTPS